MKIRSGAVWHGRDRIGSLEADARGLLHFAYAPAWLDGGFPISLSLPLSLGTESFEAHGFFAGLLPEGQSRIRICRRLRIDPNDDATLLFAIGEDCAGALSITAGEASPEDESDAPARIDQVELERLIRARGGGLLRGERQRFSLADAQDKLPVRIVGDTWYEPDRFHPSTHLVKFETIPHVCLSEYLATELARHAGLATVDIDFRLLEGERRLPWLLIERYDREETGGEISRLHQEDILQALGYAPSLKYEEDGGPALAEIISFLRSHLSDPVIASRNLVDWQIFNWVIGNFDGHAKNISLLYRPGQTLPLPAPFYDLVAIDFLNQMSHSPYARRMAFRIGGADVPERIGRTEWEQFAKDIGFATRYIQKRGREIIEIVDSSTKDICASCTEYHGEMPALELFQHHLAKRVRWCQQIFS